LLTIILSSPPILIHTLNISNPPPLRKTQFIILLGLIFVFRNSSFFPRVFDDVLFLLFRFRFRVGVVRG
jgi:hypothetical protein